jgi:hypothetical protein
MISRDGVTVVVLELRYFDDLNCVEVARQRGRTGE